MQGKMESYKGEDDKEGMVERKSIKTRWAVY
jgi:hypothetical protein